MSEALDKNARTWGMVCHLSALAMLTCIPFANVLGPLIVWLVKGKEIPFVNEQGKEALNFQITMTLVAIAALILSLVGIGIFLGLALVVVNVVFIVLASIAANKGESYRYPVSLRLIK
jgi:uncharacterized Tic20 family protein